MSASSSGPYAHDQVLRLIRHSMQRVAVSQYSILTTRELLERSHRTVSESLRRLDESEKLVSDPFHRQWFRGRLLEERLLTSAQQPDQAGQG